MNIARIQPGSDSRKNWRTINEIVAGLEGQASQNSSRRGAIAGLRQRSRDVDAGDGTGSVKMYRLKSVAADYLVCRTWNGTTEGDTDVYIAKSMKLRNSIAGATIDGASVTYSYATTVARTATISGTGEDEVVVPRFLSNDLIFAAKSDFTGVSVSGTPLVLIDLNVDGRAWAKSA